MHFVVVVWNIWFRKTVLLYLLLCHTHILSFNPRNFQVFVYPTRQDEHSKNNNHTKILPRSYFLTTNPYLKGLRKKYSF